MSRRGGKEKLNFEEKFCPHELFSSILVLAIFAGVVQLATVDLRSEFNYVSQGDYFLSIADKERFRDEGRTFVEKHGLHQPVKIGFGLVPCRKIFTLVVVGRRKIRVGLIFVVKLELQEVNTLLI